MTGLADVDGFKICIQVCFSALDFINSSNETITKFNIMLQRHK